MGDVANYIPGGADLGAAYAGSGTPFAAGGGFLPSAPSGGGLGPITDTASFAPPSGPQVASDFPTTILTSEGSQLAQAPPSAPSVAPPATPSVTVPATPPVTAGATPASVADITAAIGNQPPDMLGRPQDVTIPDGPGFFKRLAQSVGGFQKDYGPLLQLASLGIGGGSLLKQLLQPGGVEALSPLQQEQLNMMRQQQQTAQQYMQGQVTPEMQQNIQNQTQANIQQIKAKYAQMGMSGSTAEAQEIAGAEARGAAMLGQAQANMIQTGAQMLRLPTDMIGRLSAQQLAQDEAFSNALAQFLAQAGAVPPTKTA